MQRSANSWQFWIDVGGTFTDCIFQRPDGSEGQLKLLSSATVKGVLPRRRLENGFADLALTVYPEGFFRGFMLRTLDQQGAIVSSTTIREFRRTSGKLEHGSSELVPGATNYELVSPESSPLMAIRFAAGVCLGEPIPDCSLQLGTTRGTNALLTRNGAKTAFITTAGFRDLLAIGDQARPELFQLDIRKNQPLCGTSVELNERILHDGTVEQPIDESEIRAAMSQLQDQGFDSLAVCLMHGFRNPEHEHMVRQVAEEFDFANVSLSSDVAPLIKIVPRGETTSLDAYLNPLLVEYLSRIRNTLSPGSQLELMTSAGNLVPPERFSGKECTLSGPAGGVVGMAKTARAIGWTKAIGFDMGGTSTDVSRYDGEFNYEFEARKAGVRIFSPVMAIETVASGGGSICHFDGTRLLVGPQSAGADPGPACYGRSGPLTITDVNLYLGRVNQRHFPFKLDRSAVHSRLMAVKQRINRSLGNDLTPEEIAAGFIAIANTQMASAVQSVSIAKGFDVRDYLLVGFGGAAGQHLCAVADKLEIQQALVHPQASLLSAVGIRAARRSASLIHSLLMKLDDIGKERLGEIVEKLGSQLRSQLIDEGCDSGSIHCSAQIQLRFAGTESYLSVDFHGDFAQLFRNEHKRQFGYLLERPVEIGALFVLATDAPASPNSLADVVAVQPANAKSHCEMFGGNNAVFRVPEFDREQLSPGEFVVGPAQISDDFTTLVVDAGWRAVVCSDGQMLLNRQPDAASESSLNIDDARLPENETGENEAGENEAGENEADPILLEVFNNHFQSIADQMGTTLQKTSCSVNVKERLDFSCAVFDRVGNLVVNAQHIPVHLGAMSETVKAIIRLNSHINPGDVFVTNDPFNGGSHLPDVTVVSPVFLEGQLEPVFFVASRSHHAEIGGKAPGSMPPDATCLAEEGVLLANLRLFHKGEPRFEDLRQVLAGGDYPSRSIDENVADIKAQVAANRRGIGELLSLVNQHGIEVVERYMGLIMNAAAERVRAAIASMNTNSARFHDFMDNGLKIAVAINRDGDRLIVDFDGTSPTSSGNHNANRAIVSAAVMYCVRCMIAEDIPLNEGLLEHIDIRLPECFLNPVPGDSPANSPAVAAGNVETSQRIVDVLLAALGLAAASQGTMNNLLIGDHSFGYYETICGGAGATPAANGASAVHTHMTNTRLTDPEIVEANYPMIVRQFEIRKGSGGAGQFKGGNGIRREIEFLARLTVSILSNRRGEFPPFGLSGGSAGACGANWLKKTDGSIQKLDAQCTIQVEPGDRITIETPGGGGVGIPEQVAEISQSVN